MASGAAVQLEFGFLREALEQCAVLEAQDARFRIEDAHAAHEPSSGSTKRQAGVEPDERGSDDERIVTEARVRAEIGHHEAAFGLESRVADGELSGDIAGKGSDEGLQELPIVPDERDDRRQNAEGLLGEARQPIESFFIAGIEQTGPVHRSQSLPLLRPSCDGRSSWNGGDRRGVLKRQWQEDPLGG